MTSKTVAIFFLTLPVIMCPGGSYAAGFLVPSLVVALLHDDNILISPDDRQKDVITRISPSVEAGYETQRLSSRIYYSQDLETYDRNSDLDSSNMRQFLETNILYLLNERTSLALDASYSASRIPAELNISTGAGTGRVEGDRTIASPSVIYRFSPTARGTLTYSHMQEELANGVRGNTDSVNLEYEYSRTVATQVTYGYDYTHFAFETGNFENDNNAERITESVHAPYVGMFHNLNELNSISAQLGPRFSRDDVGVNFAVLYQRRYSNGRFQLSYDRGAASLIGEPGLVELDVVNASISHDYSNNFSVSLVSSYGSVSREDSLLADARIFRTAFNAHYRVNTYTTLTASYSASQQRTSVLEGRQHTPRNVAMLAITFSYPRGSESSNPRRQLL